MALIDAFVSTMKAFISFLLGERPGFSHCHEYIILATFSVRLLAGLFDGGVGESSRLGSHPSSVRERGRCILGAHPRIASGDKGLIL